jgi:hypothetical protein
LTGEATRHKKYGRRCHSREATGPDTSQGSSE